MDQYHQKPAKNFIQTQNITPKHQEGRADAREGLNEPQNGLDIQQNTRTDHLQNSATNQLRMRYSSDQHLPTIIEDRSGEKSGTDRLSASAKFIQGRESNSQTFHSHPSPAKRLNMSMFFDELASRLQGELSKQTENIKGSTAMPKFKNFIVSKQETVNNLIYSEMSAIELYIADIFNIRLSQDEPLILDPYLGNPLQVFTAGQQPSKHIPAGTPIEVVNVAQRSAELKDRILEEVQRMQALKFRHMMSAFETHIESRSVQSLEKVLNPKRVSSKSRPGVFSRVTDEQMLNGPGSPSDSQQIRPKSKLQLISQMVESYEARTSEDTDSLNNMDSKLAEITDRIDRL